MADSTIALARAQGYRDGYGQALADVQRELSAAIALASEHLRIAPERETRCLDALNARVREALPEASRG